VSGSTSSEGGRLLSRFSGREEAVEVVEGGKGGEKVCLDSTGQQELKRKGIQIIFRKRDFGTEKRKERVSIPIARPSRPSCLGGKKKWAPQPESRSKHHCGGS